MPPLTSPESKNDGDSLRPGKLAVSSSLAEVGIFTGDELGAVVVSNVARTALEPERMADVADNAGPCTAPFKGVEAAWLPVGVVAADEPRTLILGGGVFKTVSVLPSGKVGSST